MGEFFSMEKKRGPNGWIYWGFIGGEMLPSYVGIISFQRHEITRIPVIFHKQLAEWPW